MGADEDQVLCAGVGDGVFGKLRTVPSPPRPAPRPVQEVCMRYTYGSGVTAGACLVLVTTGGGGCHW